MEKRIIKSQEVREELKKWEDPAYRKFHGSLLPGIDNILGIRIPKLRELAKEFSKCQWQEWFHQADDLYYEETMLRGFVIAYAKMSKEERFEYLREFVPCINNWAVCDCLSNTVKEAKKFQKEYWDFLEPYFQSQKEYELRFGAVMLLSHFVNEEYLRRAVKKLRNIRHEGYYVKMAVAWALSVYFAAFPDYMLEYLRGDHGLDEFTYKKTLQKIVESYRVSNEMKQIIREMRG